jgi:hypothetical protein
MTDTISQQKKEYMKDRKLELQNALRDITEFLCGLEISGTWVGDLSIKNVEIDTPSLKWQEKLNKKFPISSLEHIKKMILDGIDEGWFAPYEGRDLTYGRLCKAQKNAGISIETVVMTSTGPGHVHPCGEFDLCFNLEGDAKFDGFKEGWVVYPPTSWHVPTVTEGKMAILYFLPQGAIQFQKEPIQSLEERRNLIHDWQSKKEEI